MSFYLRLEIGQAQASIASRAGAMRNESFKFSWAMLVTLSSSDH